MKEMNEKDTASVLARELLKENRSNRRWKNIRSLAWFALICLIVFNVFFGGFRGSKLNPLKNNYFSLLRLDGMIAPGREFSAENIVPLLRKAFEDKDSKGVLININSPGGTPVQSAIIHDAILTFKKKYKKKVIVVGEDMLTSGAYYVSVAADKIYVNANSLTGSVGVIVKGFGFVDLINKLGVERRVYTSGADKDRLDPFLPQTESDQEKIRAVMSHVQKNFADAVIEGRKGKLKKTPEELFTGDFWSGGEAVELGLVDGTGNLLDISMKEFNTTEFKEYGGKPAFIRMILGSMSSSVDTMLYSYL